MPFPAPEHCLVATPLVDSDHPAVHAFAHRHGHGATPREQAVHLYYAVRDGVRYDPYRLDLSTAGMRASSVLSLGYGWCVTKAALLAAGARALGIPARLGFSDVRNHMSTQRMRDTMKTDIFVWHGYTELWLDGAWRKATPAFNVELCDRFGLLPLDFDGVTDSIYHPFDGPASATWSTSRSGAASSRCRWPRSFRNSARCIPVGCRAPRCAVNCMAATSWGTSRAS